MKRTLSVFITALTLVSFTLPLLIQHTVAAETNVIANASFETASGSAPQGWTQDYWGSNTPVFQYATTGFEGTKSGYVKISNFVDGDAKWSFDEVTVTPNTSYIFTDYYKSTATTYFIARYFDSANNESYLDYGQVSPASNWTKYTLTFKTPTNAVKMTMLHLLASNGELWTDSYSLMKNVVATPTPTVTKIPTATPTISKTPTPTATSTPTLTMTPTNTPTPTVPPTSNSTIPNGTLEKVSPSNSNLPDGWEKNKWGTNTTSFAYQTTGHTGNRSVKVTVSAYTNGDAKWSYAPQPVTPGGYYRFTDYYQSNISTEVAIWVIKKDGSEDYLPLHNAPVSTNWAKYTAAFAIPNDVVKASVMHFVATKGYLVTDDYSLVPETPRTFNRALLTMTFDDGWEENYLSVLPKVESYGFKTTHCYATQYIEGSGQESRVKAFVNKGHETCSHSVTHPDMSTLSASNLTYELQHSKQYLETLAGAGKVTNFAAPFGSYNDKAFTEAQKYYTSYRTTDAGFNSRDNFDYYNIRVQNILKTTTAAEVQAWIQQAQQSKTWLVLVYHVVTNTPDEYDTTPALFDSHLAAIKQSNIAVLTYRDALTELTPQINSY
jgi:peptidoglycan/xylan/chitin deacetylase (PgdA/CDA1 family)